MLTALARRGVDAVGFDPAEQGIAALSAQCDRVWIALHGAGGEDGTVQGALECLGLPYTGSGVTGAAVGMDKLLTKRLARGIGISTPDYVVLSGPADFDTAIDQLGLPLIVKPARHGSSIGMGEATLMFVIGSPVYVVIGLLISGRAAIGGAADSRA